MPITKNDIKSIIQANKPLGTVSETVDVDDFSQSLSEVSNLIIAEAVAQVSGIVNVNLNANGTVSVPAGKYCKRVLVKPLAAVAGLSIGTGAGLDDVLSEQPLPPGVFTPISVERYADGSNLNLHFSGVSSPVTLRLYYE